MVSISILIMILVIALSCLRITTIYFNVIAYRNLLYTGVLLSILVLLVGSGVGGYVGLLDCVRVCIQTMTQTPSNYHYSEYGCIYLFNGGLSASIKRAFDSNR